ncbi:MAG: 50S ribosomal protein L10 [Anaerolineales bacterium]|nr:50S ribosomal protein L10 [Anaerolineales bacterium]MCS7249224.1 50S ribosomal protein L10 [Anaerolineales bacterium]MDW8163037.1 50S ribosomal protein L10 [Anaerolineales bacterium]MDW8448210.1 50S ribosomal protein L10 [Anaerolineales bacterium]
MAISKERKREVVALLKEWAARSEAMYFAQFTGLNMKQLNDLRHRARQSGGEFHVVKNTLARIAFKEAGFTVEESLFSGSTAIAFAFEDPPALAKALYEFNRTNPALVVKGGYLRQQLLSPERVQALSELPPLPIMRSQLLGTILAPASQLARLLAEPGRQIAAVLKAYSEKESQGQAEVSPA